HQDHDARRERQKQHASPDAPPLHGRLRGAEPAPSCADFSWRASACPFSAAFSALSAGRRRPSERATLAFTRTVKYRGCWGVGNASCARRRPTISAPCLPCCLAVENSDTSAPAFSSPSE